MLMMMELRNIYGSKVDLAVNKFVLTRENKKRLSYDIFSVALKQVHYQLSIIKTADRPEKTRIRTDDIGIHCII